MRMTDSAGKESGESNKGSIASHYEPAMPRTAPVEEMMMASTTQLADDAPATGADRSADGALMLAGAATGQQKD